MSITESPRTSKDLESHSVVDSFVRKVTRFVEYKSRADSASPKLQNLYKKESERILGELTPLREDESLASWSMTRFVQEELGDKVDAPKLNDSKNVAAYWWVTGEIPKPRVNLPESEQTVVFEAVKAKKRKITAQENGNAFKPRRVRLDAGQVSVGVLARRDRVADLLRDGMSLTEIRNQEGISKTLLSRDLNAIYAINPSLRIRPKKLNRVEQVILKERVLALSSQYTQKEIADMHGRVTPRQVTYAVASLRKDGYDVDSPEKTKTSSDPGREALYQKADKFMGYTGAVLNYELAIYLGVSEAEAKKIKRMVYHIRRRDKKKQEK